MNDDPKTDLDAAARAADAAFAEMSRAISTPTATIDLALAFARLLDVVPTVTRYNKRTEAYEPSQEVRLTFRRKSGQWYAGVGRTGRTGTNAAEAIGALADALEAENVR